MTFLRIAVIVLALVAGRDAPSLAQSNTSVDSLVLERSPCFGMCPAYRLRLARDGKVLFQSRNRGDSTLANDSITAATLTELMRRATGAGIFQLPERIMGDNTLCHDGATDHPTVTLTVFTGDEKDRVEDYHGCYHEKLRQLRNFQIAVDSALRSERWVRPARRLRGRLTSVEAVGGVGTRGGVRFALVHRAILSVPPQLNAIR